MISLIQEQALNEVTVLGSAYQGRLAFKASNTVMDAVLTPRRLKSRMVIRKTQW